jgi:hypothetical protein
MFLRHTHLSKQRGTTSLSDYRTQRLVESVAEFGDPLQNSNRESEASLAHREGTPGDFGIEVLYRNPAIFDPKPMDEGYEGIETLR